MSNEFSPSTNRSRRIALLAFTVPALILLTLNLWRYGGYLLDDTFISFRYAQNLVAGNGLVFNVGERVEGYTNFIFVLIAAALLRLGIDPVVGTKVIGLACALLLVWTMMRLARDLPPRIATVEPIDRVCFAVALLLALPGFAYWAAASFETMLFSTLVLLALRSIQREYQTRALRGAALIFVLLALTRPEGVFLFAVASTIFLIVARFDRSALRRFVINATIFVVAYGGYFAWRYHYYGDLVPNTFRAKVTGGMEQVRTGLTYVRTWILTYPLMAAALLLPLACISRRVRTAARLTPSMVALYGVALAYAVYVTLVGGDFMPFHRFFVPLLPLCCVFLAWMLDVLPPSWRRPVALVVFATHVVFAALSEEPYRAFVAHRTAVVGQRVGERLGQLLAPDDLIAVNTAGALPYFSQQPAVDMLGLTDAAIAQRPVFIVSPGWAGHRRGWGAYVLGRKPRVIFFYNSSGSREPFYLSDHELADNPYFRFFYSSRALTIPASSAADTIVGRFIGYPFGFDASLHAPWRDLGLESRFVERPIAHTVLYEGETIANYFAFDARDDDLWPARQPGNIEAFLATVVATWKGRARPGDHAARQRIDALCAAAHEKIEQGDTAAAKSMLSTAARQNDQARSPLVYQYIANVAVLDGDLFTAVAAQKEALRLAPDNELYQRNLLNLLQRPYK